MQLPLPVSLPTDETFASFVTGDNGAVVSLLSTLADTGLQWRSSLALRVLEKSTLPGVMLVGGAGKGKSHLLYAFCHQLADKDIAHLYLNLENALQWTTAVFDHLEGLPFLCLDNVHAIAGNAYWEEALFDFINRVVERQSTVLLMTSRLGATHPSFKLADLRSRLSWGLTYQLQALNDDLRARVLAARASERGLKFSSQAIQFLLHHCERDLPTLLAILERLDARSLQEQKKVSVRMVKRELGLD
ncbi:DnaA regulatory inactivator Hda [Aestuariibacter sp. A3R04]|uniref:DnaA regulatory inactivator Hda n=1 Tax=Aestuariibacter sp. A3R04 TaxID=2841571 RepID=UPI001C084B10|nr:DnaA regulatory inactivator Hda [Aestuariibacter sp. A3R04]MBU3022792.1 DnaA regulatory inactivator Hda [Aestuariibacter sp. A3R04]